jgi:hypothetical protein
MISLLMSCHVAIISSKEPLKRGGDFMNSTCIYRRVMSLYIYIYIYIYIYVQEEKNNI